MGYAPASSGRLPAKSIAEAMVLIVRIAKASTSSDCSACVT
eukprot:CAMPEP_0172706322 /NCGR_PEP_ID=MMETSP1074-20121228/45928_1 /TAXON_ID=2916 /ORGANISM="Ceratium fusus, Strain PA161109" /LENGTH=40 /DNA_ID= /DNA_START= /DNA_END= /DNA_ORIENTATION=